MRTLFLLCLSLPAFSQVFVFPVDPQLQNYLKLTQAQVDQLQRNIGESQQKAAASLTRLNRVNQEIAVETQKSSPDSLELGLRYQEIETICREQEDPRRETREKQVQALNAEQRVLAKGLGEVMKIAPLTSLASSVFFLTPDIPAGSPNLGPIFNGTDFQGPPSFRLDVPAELTAYLSLLPEQLDRIRGALQDYQRSYAVSQRRILEVTLELESELSLNVTPPRNIGDRYVELESLRREIAESEKVLRGDLQEMLTPEQRTRMQSLDTARTLQSIASSAQSLLLVPSENTRPASGSLHVSSFRSTSVKPGQVIYRTCRNPVYFLTLGDFGPLFVRE